MKKAVVLEVKKGYAAVLSEDGTFLKIRRKCNVGETIQISEKEMKKGGSVVLFRSVRTAAAAAAALVVLTAGAGGYYTTATAASYAYVEIDEDSAIEISLNHFGKVIKVQALDGKASEVVDALYAEGIKFDSIDEALGKTTKALQNGGYLDKKAAPRVDIRTENDKTFERLRSKAGEGGFEVERRGDGPGFSGPGFPQDQREQGLPAGEERPGAWMNPGDQGRPDGQMNPGDQGNAGDGQRNSGDQKDAGGGQWNSGKPNDSDGSGDPGNESDTGLFFVIPGEDTSFPGEMPGGDRKPPFGEMPGDGTEPPFEGMPGDGTEPPFGGMPGNGMTPPQS